MTIKEVASVIDDINEWSGPNGTIYYVTAIFTDESVGSAGKKNYDAALEVQGLLREAIGVEQDFTLESKGQTKTGRDKFNIKGFGTPGGAATYTAPGVQGDGAKSGVTAGTTRNHPPEPSSEQASIRASVAWKAASDLAAANSIVDITLVQYWAGVGWDWMLEKTSDASSAYPSTDSPSVTPAGASEDPSVPGSVSPGAESGGGVESEGKEPAPPPHEPDDPGSIGTEDPFQKHIHDWQPTGLHGKLKCEGCGEMRDRAK